MKIFPGTKRFDISVRRSSVYFCIFPSLSIFMLFAQKFYENSTLSPEQG